MQGEVGRITPSTRLAEFSEATPRRCRCGLPSLPPPSQACRRALWPLATHRTGSHRIFAWLGWVGDSSLAAPSQKKKNVSIAPTGRQRCIAMHRIDSSCLVTCTAGEDSQKKKEATDQNLFKACGNYRGSYGVPAPHGSVRSVGRLP